MTTAQRRRCRKEVLGAVRERQQADDTSSCWLLTPQLITQMLLSSRNNEVFLFFQEGVSGR